MSDEIRVLPSKDLTAFVPAFVDDYGFTPEEFRVFARIMRWSVGEKAQGCYESKPNLAKKLGMSEESVRRAFMVLIECKAIRVTDDTPGKAPTVTFNLGSKWLPSHQLYEIRERLFGAKINKDRERKIPRLGNDTRLGNETPPVSETIHKGKGSKVKEYKNISTAEKRDAVESQAPLPNHPSLESSGIEDRQTKNHLSAAVQAVRTTCGRYPARETWDALTKAIGENPDIPRLQNCFENWRLKGFNKVNFTWATDWYVNGIPTKFVSIPPTVTTTHHRGPTARQIHDMLDAQERELRERTTVQ